MKGHHPDPCASCSSSDCCLFIQQQMAASASHADRLSVTGRNGQISATQPFRCVSKPHTALQPTDSGCPPPRVALDTSSERRPRRIPDDKDHREASRSHQPDENMLSQQDSIHTLNKHTSSTMTGMSGSPSGDDADAPLQLPPRTTCGIIIDINDGPRCL